HRLDGLSRFGDREDDYDLPSLGTGSDRRYPDFLVQDMFSATRASGRIDWLGTAAVAGGVVLASSAFDKRADRMARRHGGKRRAERGIDIGNALPFAAVGLSAMFAFDDSRPQLSDAGVAALEASGLA